MRCCPFFLKWVVAFLVRLTKPSRKQPRKQNRSHGGGGHGEGTVAGCVVRRWKPYWLSKVCVRMATARTGRRPLCYTGEMTIKRLDHVSVVVDDLAAAIAFFTELGLTREGEASVEGPWVDRINGIEGVQVDIVMMRTPDGHGRLELTKFRNPKLVEIEPAIAPPNTLGLRSVMFTVESVDDTVARLRANGAELVGEVAQYEDKYRLCYMRGPAGIIVALAEELF